LSTFHNDGGKARWEMKHAHDHKINRDFAPITTELIEFVFISRTKSLNQLIIQFVQVGIN
jgi:hypothetical protein